jgi:hypothetical protein
MVKKIACFYTETEGNSTSESPLTSHQTTAYYIPKDSNLRYHLHGEVFTHRDRKMYYGNTGTADVSAKLFTMNKYVTVGLQVGYTVVTCVVLCSMVGRYKCSEGTYCLPLHGRNPSTYKEHIS